MTDNITLHLSSFFKPASPQQESDVSFMHEQRHRASTMWTTLSILLQPPASPSRPNCYWADDQSLFSKTHELSRGKPKSVQKKTDVCRLNLMLSIP